MSEPKMEMFRNRLSKVYRHKAKLARRQQVSCYRVYDHDLPEFPFCIELYGDQLYLAEYKRRHTMTDEEHEEWLASCIEVISELLEVPVDQVFIKQRQRKPGRLGQYQRVATEQTSFVVEENGLQFKVNLSDYLDTGLFLDHRVTRKRVQDEAAGKNVLNLFCYTGSFSVYAAAGGAREVVSMDLSNTYLQWAAENMRLNGFEEAGRYQFVQADVLQQLPLLPADHFDLVVLDPPTFSNSKRMKDFLDIQRDHVLLINDTLRTMKKGGTLYFSTNYRSFEMDTAAIQAQEIKDITRATTPFDFEGKLFRYCFRIIR